MSGRAAQIQAQNQAQEQQRRAVAQAAQRREEEARQRTSRDALRAQVSNAGKR